MLDWVRERMRDKLPEEQQRLIEYAGVMGPYLDQLAGDYKTVALITGDNSVPEYVAACAGHLLGAGIRPYIDTIEDVTGRGRVTVRQWLMQYPTAVFQDRMDERVAEGLKRVLDDVRREKPDARLLYVGVSDSNVNFISNGVVHK